MKKEKQKPIIIVIWDDAHGSATKDVTENELPHLPTVMKTMGWLLRDDEVGVSLATEVFYEDDVAYYRGHTFIPKGMIRSKTLFNLSTKPKTKKKVETLDASPVPKIIPS